MTRPGDFNSAQEIIDWLSMPENQFRNTDLFLVKWDGHTPKIHVRLIEDLMDPKQGLAITLLIEHKRRKYGKHQEEPQVKDE